MIRLGRRSMLAATGAALASFVPPSTFAQPGPPPGRLVVRGGKVLRPGQPDAVADLAIDRGVFAAAAAGGETLDATGKTVTAGFVDLLTQTGLVEISLEDSSKEEEQVTRDAVRAAFRAADGYDPAASHIPVTRAGGITSAGVVPVGGLVSGVSAWADLAGTTARDALAEPALALHVSIGDDDGGRARRGTAMLRLRELFDDARAYKQNPAAFERRQVKSHDSTRLDLAAVASAIDGRLAVFLHAHRASDLALALAFAEEQKLRAVLAGATEAWKVASEIAARKVPVVVNPFDAGPMTFSSRYAREDNAALLEKAGVSVILTTGETHNARKLRQAAGNAVRAGLSRDAALAAVTVAPARAVGLEGRYGSLEPGKVANVVVWSGDPFELSTRVEAVLVRGAVQSTRSRQTTLFERYR